MLTKCLPVNKVTKLKHQQILSTLKTDNLPKDITSKKRKQHKTYPLKQPNYNNLNKSFFNIKSCILILIYTLITIIDLSRVYLSFITNYTTTANTTVKGEVYAAHGHTSCDRYPRENLRKAAVRVNKVKEQYERRGYEVKVFDIPDSTNIDMIACNDYEVIGIEITNWDKTSYLNMSKFNGYKRHYKKLENELKARRDQRPFKKLLIVSYHSNIKSMLKHLEREHIEREVIGYQDLPEEPDEEETLIGWRD